MPLRAANSSRTSGSGYRFTSSIARSSSTASRGSGIRRRCEPLAAAAIERTANQTHFYAAKKARKKAAWAERKGKGGGKAKTKAGKAEAAGGEGKKKKKKVKAAAGGKKKGAKKAT